MKNKKGFTLIELLAVIVILAIIALIATPIVLNMINSARRSAAKSSTLGFIDSIEYYAGFHQANSGGDLGIDGYEKEIPTEKCIMENKEWKTCSDFMGDVKIKSKGSAPTDAEIEMNTAGKVQAGSWMKYNGYICIYDGKDVECDGNIQTDPSNPSTPTKEYKVYEKGDPIIYNPKEGEECDAVGGDCMTFYVITTNDDKTKDSVNAILDHNIVPRVQWSSSRNNSEMREVKLALEALTAGWNGSPRLITADEVAAITGNQTFKGETSTIDKWFYFDSNGQTQSATSTGTSQYAWLFDNTNGCTSFGCNKEDSSTNGYWTSTPVYDDSSTAWYVRSTGSLNNESVYIDTLFGVRPVITITKK